MITLIKKRKICSKFSLKVYFHTLFSFTVRWRYFSPSSNENVRNKATTLAASSIRKRAFGTGMRFLALWEPKSSKMVLYKNARLFWLSIGSLAKLALFWLIMCISLTKVTNLAFNLYQKKTNKPTNKQKKTLSKIYYLTNQMSFWKNRGVRILSSLIFHFGSFILRFLALWYFCKRHPWFGIRTWTWIHSHKVRLHPATVSSFYPWFTIND